MVNKRTPPTVADAPTPPLVIRSEQDAREAFGSDHGLQAFFRRPARVPAVYALSRAGGVPQPLAYVTIEGPSPEWWRRVEVSHDPHGSPPVTCRVDGMPIELEQHSDGVWRPRRTENDG